MASEHEERGYSVMDGYLSRDAHEDEEPKRAATSLGRPDR
jgi:hypothetical protein